MREFQAYSYGCLMAVAPKPLFDEVVGFISAIPDSDLAEDGREDMPHVTVKYGIHTDNADEVTELLRGCSPASIFLGRVSAFYNESNIVLKLSIHSPDLIALNRLVSKNLMATDSHPDYHPHMTLAYLRHRPKDPYWYREFFTNKFEGLNFTVDNLLFTTPAEKKFWIPLNTSVVSRVFASFGGVMTEEEYLESRGYGMAALGEFGVHRYPRRPSNRQQRDIGRQVSQQGENWEQMRDKLRLEYRQKIKDGEMRAPSRIERLIQTAKGHPDNASVQAARRILRKQGLWDKKMELESDGRFNASSVTLASVSSRYVITDLGKSSKVKLKDRDVSIPRYGVWDGKTGKVVETGNNLRALLKKYDLTEDSVARIAGE